MMPATEMCETSFSSVLQQRTPSRELPVSLSRASFTNTPWVQATVTDFAPASFSWPVAAMIVPPVAMMSSTMRTFFPLQSTSAGWMRTSVPESLVFSRWS